MHDLGGARVSRIQSLILGNPNLAAKFMTGMSPGYWETEGRKQALGLFRTASTKVAAYKSFLAERGFDPASVKTFEDFATIPITDKASYFAGHKLDEMITGKVSDTHIFYMSGGTTGDSMIGAASRETLRKYPPSLAAIFHLQWDLCDPNNRVLLINAMSLGAWIGGTYTSAIFQQISDRWPNISYTSPGADVDRILDLVEAVGSSFDTLVLTSYPTYVKEVLNAGRDRGIDWKAHRVKVIVSGERLDAKLRREILTTISDPIDHHAIMDQYGASEMGNPGAETPLVSTIIRLASENVELCCSIFGADEPLTLLQNNPLGAFLEIVDGRIVGTAGSFMPVVRYTPKDLGRMMRYDDMLKLLAGHGIDITKSLAQDGWTKPLYKWPFLAVLGRADYAVSIYGAKVSPQSIQDVFAADSRVRRFRLGTDEDGSYTVMTVDLELPPDLVLAGADRIDLANHYSLAILKRLLELNFDYRDAHSIHAEAMVPSVRVHDHGTGPFATQATSFKPKSL
jgi:phenylacetate-CoA ligase